MLTVSLPHTHLNRFSPVQYQKWVHSEFIATGPCLTNVSYTGTTADGAMRTKVEVSLARTDRFNKNFHHVRYRVQKVRRILDRTHACN